MKNVLFVRRPNSLWAGLALLVAVSGLLAAPFGRQDAARRVRAGGTRGVGVIHQVRVEPYGRSAVEHAYFDDDEAASHGGKLTGVGPDTPSSPDVRLAFVAPVAAWTFSAVSSSAAPPPDTTVHSGPLLGIPSGRAPPLA